MPDKNRVQRYIDHDLSDLDSEIDVITGYHAVPSQDSAANGQLRDVVGNKTDTVSGDSLVALMKDIVGKVNPKLAGRRQVFEKSVTSAANVGDVTLATITTQPCVIKSIVIHVDTASQVDLTSAAVTGGASKVIIFIDASDAAKENLDAIDEQVAWTGAVRLVATKTIIMTLVGTGATPVDLTVTITYFAAVTNGYLV